MKHMSIKITIDTICQFSQRSLGWQAHGGIIMDPKGNIESRFTWGLGEYRNNQATTYALLQCLHLEIVMGLKSLIITSDSSAIIKSMLS
jgi:ribonuclease HI